MIAAAQSGDNFKAMVSMFCACGWLMQEAPNGYYCENPLCGYRAHLYAVNVNVSEVNAPCASSC
jgi:hypothetical protein